MKFYYLSSQANSSGNFEIHEKECELIPGPMDRDYLGPFNNGAEALRRALLVKPSVVCCDTCCKQTTKATFGISQAD